MRRSLSICGNSKIFVLGAPISCRNVLFSRLSAILPSYVFFFIAIGSIEPRDYRVVFFIQEAARHYGEPPFAKYARD